MERKACTTRSDLERLDLEQMLAVGTAEPKALPLFLLEEITANFSCDREIGRGGFAVVYKGIIGDRAVAVKRLSNAFMDDKEFHREVQCLMRVKHKNVVRFLGYCADRQGSMATYNGKLIMADIHQRLLCFEYIPKGGLDKYITDACREWRTCYKIIKGICEGIQFLHDNHIIHLDLKPANILLDDSMVPKITDFGLSRCFDENQSRDITKTILGTMGYLAPEFREGGVIAPSADLYSLGVIIIEILTGQKGYLATGNVLESWSDRLERSQRDRLSEQIRVCYEIALECRDFNPKKRPASAQDIIDRLHRTESIQTAEAASSASGMAASESKGKSKDVFHSSEPRHAVAAPPVVMPQPVGPAPELVQAPPGSVYSLVETKPLLPARLGAQGAAMATRVSSMYDMVESMQYLYVSVVKARDLPTMDSTGALGAYVEVKLGNFRGITRCLEKNANPVWGMKFAFSFAHLSTNQVEVNVKDKGTLRDELLGRVVLDRSDIPSCLPPDSPLAPQWYSLSGAYEKRFGEIMLAVWNGSQADEAFPEAFHSEAYSLSPEGLSNRRSQVYYSPKLVCLKVYVIEAIDLFSAEIGRPLASTIAKIQMGSQIQRTRPQRSASPLWVEEFMFVASEPFEDPLVVTVEEKVDAGRDEPIGRVIIHVASTHVQGNDLSNSVPSKWFSLSRGMTVDEAAEEATTGNKHREHSRTLASKIIPVAVASAHVRRNYLSRWVPSPAKLFRLSRSRARSVDEAASAAEAVAADETAADVTASMAFDSKIHLRTSLEPAYHVPMESTYYSSDLQPAAEKLRKSAIGVLEVGILGARDLGDNRYPYCVAKYGAKWVRTRTLLRTVAPKWNEPYTWEVFDLSTVITVAVFDNNHLSGHGNGSTKENQPIGKVRIRLATLESDRVYTHYYPLMALSPSGLKKTGELHLAVRFTCTAWANMLAQYGWPLLPKMHYTNPISVLQLDNLRSEAVQLVAKRLGRVDPPLPREVVEYMLDVGSHMFSLRRSKANFNRISSLLSVARWFDGICKWKNPLTTILVHVGFLKLVCYPELILPTMFVSLIMIIAWNYFRRPREPLHIDTVLSRVELAHPNEHIDPVMWWYTDLAYPDELDEEFDTFPTSKPDDIVRVRYERLRSLFGMVQTAAGDVAAQGERAQSLLRWHDPRLTPVFMALSLVMAVVLYLTPFRMLSMGMGLYFLRPPWFRGRTNLLFNLFSRLPSKEDEMLYG